MLYRDLDAKVNMNLCNLCSHFLVVEQKFFSLKESSSYLTLTYKISKSDRAVIFPVYISVPDAKSYNWFASHQYTRADFTLLECIFYIVYDINTVRSPCNKTLN